MSTPDSRRWVANEWRSVAAVACLMIPALAPARDQRTAERLCVPMVSPVKTGSWIHGCGLCRKQPIPYPGLRRSGIFARKRRGNLDGGKSARPILGPEDVRMSQLTLKSLAQWLREHHETIFATLAAPDDDDAAVEIDIFHSKGQAFAEPQPGPVENRRHELVLGSIAARSRATSSRDSTTGT
jgi:hypothetical protein